MALIKLTRKNDETGKTDTHEVATPSEAVDFTAAGWSVVNEKAVKSASEAIAADEAASKK